MKLSSGILALLTASQAFSYSIEALNKRQATIDDICAEKLKAGYLECLFLDTPVGKVSAESFCPVFTSEKCQSIYINLPKVIPECLNISDEARNSYLNVKNTYALISFYLCNKDENGQYCPYDQITYKNDPDLNELKAATEATCKSKKCTDQSIEAFNTILEKIQNSNVPDMVDKINNVLGALQSKECASLSPENRALAACKEKLDPHQECIMKMEKNENPDKFCNAVLSEKCQTILKDVLSFAPECKSIPQDQLDQLVINANTNYLVSKYACNKSENGDYCPFTFIDNKGNPDLEDVKKATVATCESKKCTESSIEAFTMISEALKNLVAPGVPEKVDAVLKNLKSKECADLNGVREKYLACEEKTKKLESCITQGKTELNEFCSLYSSKECQDYIKNPLEAVPECNSLPEKYTTTTIKNLLEHIKTESSEAERICKDTKNTEVPTTVVEPEKPTDNVEPEVPTTVVEPEKPTDDVEPEIPTDDVEPEKPTDDVEPEKPTDDVEPEIPTGDIDSDDDSDSDDEDDKKKLNDLINDEDSEDSEDDEKDEKDDKKKDNSSKDENKTSDTKKNDNSSKDEDKTSKSEDKTSDTKKNDDSSKDEDKTPKSENKTSDTKKGDDSSKDEDKTSDDKKKAKKPHRKCIVRSN